MNPSVGPLWEREEDDPLFFRFFAVVFALMVAFFSVNLWFNARFVRVEVEGTSMTNTLSNGDVLYADKKAVPARGDIVIVDVKNYPEKKFRGEYIIKRLIATQGDTLYCQNNTVHIRYAGEEDFVPLEEDYLKNKAQNASFAAVTVGEGEIFVMGDNRADSKDSRMEGCFLASDIIGKVTDWSVKHKATITKFWHFFG